MNLWGVCCRRLFITSESSESFATTGNAAVAGKLDDGSTLAMEVEPRKLEMSSLHPILH